MAGTNDDPFLESVAQCSFCLDFNASYLRRQWRRFGRVPAVEVPYGITVRKLGDNFTKTGCEDCGLLVKAAEHITHEFGMDFKNMVFEYIDSHGLRGLSLGLSLLHPTHASDAVLESARLNQDLDTRLVTAPSEDDLNRKTEHRISSPSYEIVRVSEGVTRAQRHGSGQTGLLTWPSRSGDTGSDAALQWVKAQMEKCLRDHSLCNVQDADGKLPTRVLDLGEDLSALTADPKLRETHGEISVYACLSHCWGIAVPLETTRETLAAFTQRIPWDQLPKTFQHAVIFTRRLGIRYLWIDSLCIIQHDADDWYAEAGKMASVYEGAQLTLAAAASSDSRGGLFQRAPSEACLSLEEGIYLRQLPESDFFRQPGKSQSPSEGTSPLLKRAWVLQERLLSRRMIYFTPLELVLECRVGKATESGQDWIDVSLKQAFSVAYGSAAIDHESLSAMWRDLVQLFTHLRLTRAADTLPAMAGLAKRMSRKKEAGNAYLAGLWRHELLADLLWARSGHGLCRINGEVPSWSWARSDAPKYYTERPNAVPLCHFVDAKCISDRGAGDLFLHVDGGHISVSGFLIPAKVKDSGVVVGNIPRVRHVVRRDYDWHEPPEPEPAVRSGDRLFFLPIVAFPDKSDIRIVALALRADDKNGGCEKYRRVGIASMKILYLEPYHYIFNAEEMLIHHLKNKIALAESLLQEDGRYRSDDSDRPVWLQKDANEVENLFRADAHFEHLCLYGSREHPEVSLDDFYGLPHIEVLKKKLLDESKRVAEWKRRNEDGEEQIHEREMITIV